MAVELDLACWVDLPDHSGSLSIEQHPIAAGAIPAVTPTHDGDVVGIDLREDWPGSRREVWDFYQNPGLCPEPEHLHRAKILATATLPAGDVALLA